MAIGEIAQPVIKSAPGAPRSGAGLYVTRFFGVRRVPAWQVFLWLAVFAFWYVAALPAQAASGTWVTRAGLPLARTSLAVASGSDGRIYALGGTTASSSVLRNADVYSPAGDTWTSLPPMLLGRANFVAAAGHDGRICAFGGIDGAGGYLSSVEAFTPSGNLWAVVSPMPTARGYAGIATAPDGRIFVIGGLNGGSTPLTTVEAYNPLTDTWTSKAPMPTGRWLLAAVTGVDGRVYAIGGRTVSPAPAMWEPSRYTTQARTPGRLSRPCQLPEVRLARPVVRTEESTRLVEPSLLRVWLLSRRTRSPQTPGIRPLPLYPKRARTPAWSQPQTGSSTP